MRRSTLSPCPERRHKSPLRFLSFRRIAVRDSLRYRLATPARQRGLGTVNTSLIVRVFSGELLLLLEDSEQRGKEPQFSDENWGSSHLATSWQDGALRDHSQQLLRPLCSHRTQHVADRWPICGYYNLSSSRNAAIPAGPHLTPSATRMADFNVKARSYKLLLNAFDFEVEDTG